MMALLHAWQQNLLVDLMIDRVARLDLLRGACALGLATCQVLFWKNEADVYAWNSCGVYIFSALIGASMVVAYDDKSSCGYSASRLLTLRLTRLMPLYLFALLLGFVPLLYQTVLIFALFSSFMMTLPLERLLERPIQQHFKQRFAAPVSH